MPSLSLTVAFMEILYPYPCGEFVERLVTVGLSAAGASDIVRLELLIWVPFTVPSYAMHPRLQLPPKRLLPDKLPGFASIPCVKVFAEQFVLFKVPFRYQEQ